MAVSAAHSAFLLGQKFERDVIAGSHVKCVFVGGADPSERLCRLATPKIKSNSNAARGAIRIKGG
jgi:hypothetical protein